MPVFNVDQLESVGKCIFQAVGAIQKEAEIVAGLLANANLTGHDSHGVIRIPQYLGFIETGHIVLNNEIEILRQTKSSAVINGNWGFGQVIASKAINIAIEKAKSTSVSTVTVQSCNHVGRLADYAQIAADQNLIAMLTVNNHGAGTRVAPWGGSEGRLSTNPICFAIPRESHQPILVDITTSVVAEGKVRVKRNRNEKVPEGWIIDANGNPTIDPNDLYKSPMGAILPFGGTVGHKGFALSMVVDILSGALSGAGCSRESPKKLGNAIFMTLFDISSFVPIEEFYQEIDNFVDWIKSARTAPGFAEITIPGEPENRIEQKRRKEGIFIEEQTWQQIEESAEKVGVDLGPFI
ncbi:TPA: Ldh family oxidoreductase [Candidatus Poribacteria bacterium]|nr:Ldh family oxidoreductase [Candidatus Poribacteria bacterium]